MLSHFRAAIVVTLLFAATMPDYADAGLLPFLDDFDDGDFSDGNPVLWRLAAGGLGVGGTRSVENGDLIISHNEFASIFVDGSENVNDVTLRTQLRVLDPGSNGVFAALAARGNTGELYWGGIRSDGRIFLGSTRNSITTTRQEQGSSLDPIANDVWMQLGMTSDLAGTHVALTVWEDGVSMPTTPQLGFDDSVSGAAAPGSIGLFINTDGGIPRVAFRSFEAIPEPSSRTLGALALLALSKWRRKRLLSWI